MLRFRRWVAARLIEILEEIRMSRASTQHLTAAVSALALAVSDSAKKIADEVALLKTAQTDGDDDEVNAAADRIAALTTQLTDSVRSANTAVQQTPPDGAPAADPAAKPADAPAGGGAQPQG